MFQPKRASKQKRRACAIPLMGAAGLSLSVATGASAATVGPAAHEIPLYEEEVSDVSLATFYVFDKESIGTGGSDVQLVGRGGHGGCHHARGCHRGCGGCHRGCRGCHRGCGGCGGRGWGGWSGSGSGWGGGGGREWGWGRRGGGWGGCW